CSVRPATKAASNSSYRYMTVLTQMLAVVRHAVQRQGRAWSGGPDAFAQPLGHDLPIDLRDLFAFKADDATGGLGGGQGGVARFTVFARKQPRRLQILSPVPGLVEIDSRARNQFIAR